MKQNHIFTFQCPDQTGVQATVCTLLQSYQAQLTDIVSFSDPDTHLFFSRIVLKWTQSMLSFPKFVTELKELASTLNLTWQITPSEERVRTLIAVSKEGHCLNDLLYRAMYRGLPIDIVGIVSNHETFRRMVESHNIPFHYLPMNDFSCKEEQEMAIEAITKKLDVELLVLARYMQILSNRFSTQWFGRCINIHHSFLPSFKGANPYKKAYNRGVKIIGATAHYITPELDEGPIIEQDIESINHKETPDILKNKGRDIESRVLGRAVRWHAEKRIFISGHKTIVFS